MEGEVTGRGEREVVRIDEKFILNSRGAKIGIADREVELRVPSYLDYFILKAVSARPSDVRDIATLVWRNGIPRGIRKRTKELMPYPELFKWKIKSLMARHVHDNGFR
jgi:hypothetical protein